MEKCKDNLNQHIGPVSVEANRKLQVLGPIDKLMTLAIYHSMGILLTIRFLD